MTEGARETDEDSQQVSRRQRREQQQTARRARRRQLLGSVGFATAVLLLIAAIPVLGLVGRNLIENSNDGKILTNTSDPKAPGYEALVDPTPTALVVQTGPDGKISSATVLALGSGNQGGGSVILVPLGTQLRQPGSGVDRLRYAYEFGGVKILRDQIGSLLGIGVGEVIELGNARWAELTRPVGSVTLDNPDTVTAADGTQFPSGNLTLTPDEVGPFLAATNDNESDINRLVRQQLFWNAWLGQLAARGDGTNLVPGEAGTGMSRFARTLAKATSDVKVLAVADNPDPAGPPFVLDEQQARSQMNVAVPFPVGAYPGQRTRVRLLNGVRAGAVPATVTDSVALGGGEIIALGNADKFGQTETRIEYYSKATRQRVQVLRSALGVGKLVFKPQPDQSVDATVIVGSDLQETAARRGSTVPATPTTATGASPTSSSSTGSSPTGAEGSSGQGSGTSTNGGLGG